jgi:hypothetical protein
MGLVLLPLVGEHGHSISFVSAHMTRTPSPAVLGDDLLDLADRADHPQPYRHRRGFDLLARSTIDEEILVEAVERDDDR